MPSTPAVSAVQVQMMTEVVEQYPNGPFTAHYKEVLASHSWKPDVQHGEQAPKPQSKGGKNGYGKAPLGPTAKQLDFIAKLLASREVPGELRTLATSPELTFKSASKVIDALKTCPWKPKKTAAPEKTVGEGFYCREGVYYKVQRSPRTGNLYCKKWDGAAWEYVGNKPLGFLADGDTLTREQAKQFSELYGCCINCRKTLTDELSISRGVGKDCWKNLGWS